MHDVLDVADRISFYLLLCNRDIDVRRYRSIHSSTIMEGMADNVLNEIDREFMDVNADEIRQFANEQFAGSIDIDKRGKYQSIFLTLGGRQEICWTCGGSLKHLGKKLEQWL